MVRVLIVIVLAFVAIQIMGARRRMRLGGAPVRQFYSQVHGITHRNADGTSRQKIISKCRLGETLDLVLEPTNRHDPDAIRICRRNGEQLGYWSGSDGEMAEDLRAGKRFHVVIDEIYPFEEDSKQHGVRLRVDVLKRIEPRGA